MIVISSPINDRSTPTYVTTSSVKRYSFGSGGLFSDVLADISYSKRGHTTLYTLDLYRDLLVH